MNHQSPILFGFRDTVVGRGFIASVSTKGRALLTQEAEEDFWFYGVNPGGIAAGGNTPAAAHNNFRESFRGVLYDLASDSTSFEGFRLAVHEFIEQTNRPNERAWIEACQSIAAEREDGIDLPVLKADDHKPKVDVDLVGEFDPVVNELDQELATACA